MPSWFNFHTLVSMNAHMWVYIVTFKHTMNACSNYIFICNFKSEKHFILVRMTLEISGYIFCYFEYNMLYKFLSEINCLLSYPVSSAHLIRGIEMQDNYIAVQFQRSFHDMGGGRKSAVEFSSFSSSFSLCIHISYITKCCSSSYKKFLNSNGTFEYILN